METFEEFGIRPPELGETPLSWQEVLVWLRMKEENEILS